MKSLNSFCWAALWPLMLTGCGTTSPHVTSYEKIPDRIERGKSTKAQVRSLLGDPDSRRIDPNGETWIYGDDGHREPAEVVVDQAVGVGAGFIPVPYAGTAINSLRSLGSIQTAQASARVDFDRRGVVRDYAINLP